jgi:hypothetical protein
MAETKPRKLVRSYRLVFRRRWRIFRIQGWRIPLPGGLELRLLGYWLACLTAAFLAARLPLLGILISSAPDSIRLLALPLAAAWGLSRWEVDGRPPHRALLGLLAWRLRPRHLAALRRCPAPGTELVPLGELSLAPDLASAEYPRGRVRGPARLLLRYPVAVEATSPRLPGRRPARTWRIRPLERPPLQSGKTIEIPAGATVLFEGARR